MWFNIFNSFYQTVLMGTPTVSDFVAVISLIATISLGILGFLVTRQKELWERRTEAQKLIEKYRDPLLLASQDLQSRLYNILDRDIRAWIKGSPEQTENLHLYTAFLMGQFLSWTYILRHETRFLKFTTDEKHKSSADLLANIREVLSTETGDSKDVPFRLWRGQQVALGEVMTKSDGSQLCCLGYAEFCQKYKASGELIISPKVYTPAESLIHVNTACHPDFGVLPTHLGDDFRWWFDSLVVGIHQISAAADDPPESVANINRNRALLRGRQALEQRMRQLHHLLLDLCAMLDPEGYYVDKDANGRCHRAIECKCTKCTGMESCPCSSNVKARCPHAERRSCDSPDLFKPENQHKRTSEIV